MKSIYSVSVSFGMRIYYITAIFGVVFLYFVNMVGSMISLSCDSSILYHTCDSGEKFGAEMKSTLRTSHSSGNSKAESTDE